MRIYSDLLTNADMTNMLLDKFRVIPLCIPFQTRLVFQSLDAPLRTVGPVSYGPAKAVPPATLV